MVNFREYITASGLRVFGGKNAENNDELVFAANTKDSLLHTSEPGSPFVNVKDNPSRQDIKEAAVFCAKYSQDWRGKRRDVVVNIFKRSDMNKSIRMKAGSWEVKKQKKIKVKAVDILKFEKMLREIK
ncbi:MAG: NFACT RNA binding domain-containing protein [Nanoarchaeota archaeon]|nr:NFACT RNA binding domain-containing protein [Nanoarchaeota archaeon]